MSVLKSFKVKYRVNHTQSRAILQLHGGTESEAIAKLKQRGTVPQDATVIILSIEPA
jgi:hypothetical protein